MNCPSCAKEVVADKLFCIWCESFIPDVNAGKKAGLFARWFACAIDPLCALAIAGICWMVIGGTIGQASGSASVFILGIGFFAHIALNLVLLSKGMTVGKWLLGLQVVNKFNGGNPGIFKMLVREIVGKFISTIFLSLGFFWAIWDKDSQAWHDKIAGTVVIKRNPNRATSQQTTISVAQTSIQSSIDNTSQIEADIKNIAQETNLTNSEPIQKSIQAPTESSQPKQQNNNVIVIAATCVIITLIIVSGIIYLKRPSKNISTEQLVATIQPSQSQVSIKNKKTLKVDTSVQNEATKVAVANKIIPEDKKYYSGVHWLELGAGQQTEHWIILPRDHNFTVDPTDGISQEYQDGVSISAADSRSTLIPFKIKNNNSESKKIKLVINKS